MKKTKFKVIRVGEGGVHLLPLPESVLKALGWAEGDVLEADIPTSYPDQLIVYRGDNESK